MFARLPLRARVVYRAAMKTTDYQAILRSVEQAIEVCDQSSGFMDQVHREMCEELRAIRGKLHVLLRAAGPPSVTMHPQ